jgi:hypothetical protein
VHRARDVLQRIVVEPAARSAPCEAPKAFFEMKALLLA